MDSDLEEFLEQYHRSVEAVVNGDPGPQERLWFAQRRCHARQPARSACARADRSDAIRRAVSQLSDGEILGSERISAYSGGDLAYTLSIERSRAKLGGASERVPVSLRVTTIFRCDEDG